MIVTKRWKEEERERGRENKQLLSLITASSISLIFVQLSCFFNLSHTHALSLSLNNYEITIGTTRTPATHYFITSIVVLAGNYGMVEVRERGKESVPFICLGIRHFVQMQNTKNTVLLYIKALLCHSLLLFPNFLSLFVCYFVQR